MINWEKQDLEYIVKNIITPVLEEYAKINLQTEEQTFKTYKVLFETLTDRIRELDYEIQKDKRYIRAFLSTQFNYTQESMEASYNAWSEEYDKLNKHLLK